MGLSEHKVNVLKEEIKLDIVVTQPRLSKNTARLDASVVSQMVNVARRFGFDITKEQVDSHFEDK